jgi:hypothetical protein
MDGRLEAVQFITKTGREGSSVLESVLGRAAPLQLCPAFTGVMDDFRVERSFPSISYTDDYTRDVTRRDRNAHFNVFPREGGRFETPTVHAAKGSVFRSLTAAYSAPPETTVEFYVRGGDQVYTWTENEPPWVAVRAGVDAATAGPGRGGIIGEYFQVAAVLYADGGGTVTPSVTGLGLSWDEEPPPLPPFLVEAVAGDGEVTVEWAASVDDNAAGYRVYFGERPGEYLGSPTVAVASPALVGNSLSWTLGGLQNGRVYYFAVAAVSSVPSGDATEEVVGELSREVFARPLRVSKK